MYQRTHETRESLLRRRRQGAPLPDQQGGGRPDALSLPERRPGQPRLQPGRESGAREVMPGSPGYLIDEHRALGMRLRIAVAPWRGPEPEWPRVKAAERPVRGRAPRVHARAGEDERRPVADDRRALRRHVAWK